MNIVLITPVFELSEDPGSDRYYYFCKHLVQKGHAVTVLTSAVNYKLASIRPDCLNRFRTTKSVGGITIEYVWSYPNLRGNFFKRLIYLFSFMLATGFVGMGLPHPDLLYVPNTPGMVGFIGYILSKLRRIPLIFEVADVWPDAAMAMGALTNPLMIWMARQLESLCYGRAVRIVALTRGIKANLTEKGIAEEKIVLVPNGVDPGLFNRPNPEKAASLRRQLGTNGCFISLYLGAHGHYNSLWTIIETARELSRNPQFLFIMIGDGDYKPHLQEMVEQFGITNVIFIDPIKRSECVDYLALADVFLLPNRKGDFYRMNLPNKLFDFLMASRPVIVAGEGETGDVVLAAEAGLVVPAEDSKEMASVILSLASLPEQERCRMGANARRYVMEHYNRESHSQIIEEMITDIVENHGH